MKVNIKRKINTPKLSLPILSILLNEIYDDEIRMIITPEENQKNYLAYSENEEKLFEVNLLSVVDVRDKNLKATIESKLENNRITIAFCDDMDICIPRIAGIPENRIFRTSFRAKGSNFENQLFFISRKGVLSDKHLNSLIDFIFSA